MQIFIYIIAAIIIVPILVKILKASAEKERMREEMRENELRWKSQIEQEEREFDQFYQKFKKSQFIKDLASQVRSFEKINGSTLQSINICLNAMRVYCQSLKKSESVMYDSLGYSNIEATDDNSQIICAAAAKALLHELGNTYQLENSNFHTSTSNILVPKKSNLRSPI